jgi:tetratricopeptide (TPR) repeat protein
MRKVFYKLILLPGIFFICSSLNVFSQDFLPTLVKKVKPSAVAIETFDARGRSLSRGSGFFISENKVITNKHVIEKANRVDVQLMNGNKYTAHGVLAIDGEGDLALLQIEVPPGFAVPLPITENVPEEGESILVIGNPFGLEGSVSNGIVSAVREIPGYGKIIQITAPISPGSSGSPVVNMRGQLIGVASLQSSQGQSLNFAVPSERIARLRSGELQTFASFNSETQKSNRRMAESFYSQGLRIASGDDFRQALHFFNKAVEIDPTYAEAWYQAGFCYGMLGKHEEALVASKNAARLRPRWSETYVNIGVSSFALRRYDESAEAYKKATKLNPYKAEYQYALGLVFNKLNRNDEEMLAYKRAIEIKPDYASAIEALGLAYFNKKNYRQSLEAFEQLKNYKPDAKTYNYLGESYFQVGKMQESVEAFNNAVSYNPQFDEARFNLGKAYLKLGDQDSATVQYEILRTTNSDWADRLYVLINP